MDYINLKGQINNEGKLMISGKAEMKDFLSHHKTKNVLIRIEAFAKKSTEAQIGFYFGKIIPDIQKGFHNLGYRISTEETDSRVRGAYYLPLPDDLKELDKEQMKEYIDFVMQWASENLYVFIPDPRTF